MLTAVEPARFPWGDYRRYTFSLGLRTGDDLVLSGQTAATFNPEHRRMELPEGIVRQVEVIYDKIDAVLVDAGFATSDVVRVVEYISAAAASEHEAVAAVRRRRLGSEDAVSTTVCVDRLLRNEALVEIALEARRTPAVGSAESCPVHLPSILPEGARGGSIRAQVDDVLDRAESRLAAIGASWANVVFALEHVAVGTGDLPPETVLDRTDRIGQGCIAGARVGTRRLIHDDIGIQLDLTVSHEPIEIIEPEADRRGASTLADAVRDTSRIYLSGQSGGPGASESADVGREADVAYRRLLAALERAGGRRDALLATIEHVTHEGLSTYAETASIRRNLLPLPFSAATGTVCSTVDGSGCFTIYGTAAVR